MVGMPTYVDTCEGVGRYRGVLPTKASEVIFQAMDPERDEDIALMTLVRSYAQERGVRCVPDQVVLELAEQVIDGSGS